MTAAPSRRIVLAGALSLAGLGACSGRPTPTTPGASAESSTPATPTRLLWGPTQAQYEEAKKTVAGWKPEQLAGQVLVLTYAGTEPADAAAAVDAVHAAGVIVMGDNATSADQVQATAKAVQQAVAGDGRDFPAVVTVDQEGGLVARLGSIAPATPTFMTAGAVLTADPANAPVVTATARASGDLLRSLGFTWVFAPDADVTLGPDDPTIGSRSASSDPATVSKAVTAAIAGYSGAGIVSSAKHYPGHGSVTADSHKTLPVQKASLDDLRATDLIPFKAATEAGVPVLMMSHIAVDAIEPGVPCTLSVKAYESLRAETGFEGVICTDAMNMEAITQQYGAGPAAARAVIAGADMVLMPASGPQAHAAIVAALTDGTLTRDRLAAAAAKVVALQLWQGAQSKPTAHKAAADALSKASTTYSAAGITQVGGTCGGALVTTDVQVSGSEKDVAAFTTTAEKAGLTVGSGPTVFLATSVQPGNADIVVAVDTPYVLARCQAGTAAFALYGRTPGAFAALLDVLTGKVQASGRLPVPVQGLPASSC